MLNSNAAMKRIETIRAGNDVLVDALYHDGLLFLIFGNGGIKTVSGLVGEPHCTEYSLDGVDLPVDVEKIISVQGDILAVYGYMNKVPLIFTMELTDDKVVVSNYTKPEVSEFWPNLRQKISPYGIRETLFNLEDGRVAAVQAYHDAGLGGMIDILVEDDVEVVTKESSSGLDVFEVELAKALVNIEAEYRCMFMTLCCNGIAPIVEIAAHSSEHLMNKGWVTVDMLATNVQYASVSVSLSSHLVVCEWLNIQRKVIAAGRGCIVDRLDDKNCKITLITA